MSVPLPVPSVAMLALWVPRVRSYQAPRGCGSCGALGASPGSAPSHTPSSAVVAAPHFPGRGVYPRNVFFPWAADQSAQGLLCALSWAAPKLTTVGRGSGARLDLTHYGCALNLAAQQLVGPLQT